MKKFFVMIGWLLGLCHGVNAQQYIQIKKPKDLKKFIRYQPKDYFPLISAHRGGIAEGFPENCIPTFENTLKTTYAIIECDIQMSKDSVLVMMHDKELDRTTDMVGKVRNFTVAELKKRKLKDNEGKITPYTIPTLAEVLAWGKGKTVFTLDIKDNFPLEKLVHEIQKAKAHAYSVVITYTFEQAKKLYDLDKKLCFSVSFKQPKDWEAFEKTGIPPSQVMAFVGVGRVNEELVQFLHKKKIMCILGTMGKIDSLAEAQGGEVYETLYQKGADVLSTDKVGILALHLQKSQRLKPIKSKKLKYIKFATQTTAKASKK
ncbi:MAG: glycerophosphodiester phosphodiesterase family protein [Microscillaceae bacterium]|nr:glycerophosphodiester phosphodiesterase family protein [Microscillaceae bacterium]MDW8461846.1 glycerophosphodiester phosphodiesterase family protein [Cytophagales bacterium]